MRQFDRKLGREKIGGRNIESSHRDSGLKSRFRFCSRRRRTVPNSILSPWIFRWTILDFHSCVFRKIGPFHRMRLGRVYLRGLHGLSAALRRAPR